MSVLEELKKLANGLNIPSGAIRFEQEAPETYLVSRRSMTNWCSMRITCLL